MSVRRPTLAILVLLCSFGGLLLLGGTSVLAAEEHIPTGSFGGEGSGNGQFKEVAGVAVNDSTGEVYVVDEGDNRVERFSAGGAFESQFNGIAAPNGVFSSPTGIAVDNSTEPLDPSTGDVYVIDTGHHVIDKFNAAGVYEGELTETAGGVPLEELYGVAVDPYGNVWVYESNGYVDEFDDFGGFIGRFNTGRSTAPGLAVDSNDNVYAFVKYLAIVEYGSETGSDLYESNENINASALAVDLANNNLFVDRTNPETDTSEIEVYTPFEQSSPTPFETFGTGGLPESPGIAVNSVTGTVYATERGTGEVDSYMPVVLPTAATGQATNVGVSEGTATINGTVDPNGQPVTSCEFEYGTEASYGIVVPCEQTSGQIGSGTGHVTVSATVHDLAPGTAYHYRLIAANTNSGDSGVVPQPGSDEVFVAPAHPNVENERVLDVTANSVTLAALVHPEGLDTTYRFEYGTSEMYGASVPVPEANAGSGLTQYTADIHLQNLQPRTAYFFRIVATNAFGTRDGVGDSFTTQSAGGEFVLPDGRAWEMVSPSNKHGALILPVSEGVVQAAENGSAFTYLTVEPIVADPMGNSKESQVLATRGAGGWETQDISTPHEDGEGVGLGQGEEYWAFSPDLAYAIVRPFGGSSPAPNLPGREGDLYIRDNRNGTYNLLAETEGFNEEVYAITSKWNEEQVGLAGGALTGPYRAFMSNESLTGYDNHDANSGEPDEEVFLENRTTKHIACVSCDPTGALPVGIFDRTTNENGEGLLVDATQEWGDHWLAGSIPGLSPLDAGGDSVREPRFLDPATGRLFFNSQDALVPQATNGLENVYEYEPTRVGSCTSSEEGFSDTAEGCISLISSGTSNTESAFLDASADGSDVFFLTSAKLVPQDIDGAFDVYDAHACSEASPCIPPSPVSPPACTTADSCRAAPTPQPTIYGLPSSATFAGAGNASPPALKPVVSPKSLTRAQKLSRALRTCRRRSKKHKKQRATCEARAKRAYGSAAKRSVASGKKVK